jgi:CheY-specific phosphatase CheX
MNAMSDQRKGFTVVFLLGAVGGGLLVALATRAIPKMMSQIMSGMMQNMISQMSESGCDPSEM